MERVGCGERILVILLGEPHRVLFRPLSHGLQAGSNSHRCGSSWRTHQHPTCAPRLEEKKPPARGNDKLIPMADKDIIGKETIRRLAADIALYLLELSIDPGSPVVLPTEHQRVEDRRADLVVRLREVGGEDYSGPQIQDSSLSSTLEQ
uniref:Uncharacterized protein n=1 Tax=Candidatus Kentrum sp. FM TaxID=2126340 RepID=A0A450X2C8_9GAMM|nr:MAG: hypothetical protein BECKFM1743C_GA0114222_103406 [Candidatus Kentron sp. FM]VFJ64082.1 MAG: hypothetical protein BECKFM1743A_GA0114220_103476 [Candidatus Kentron sp. FM]VFK23464.1 MAG: hypothetical protein BECKFM1743B_GA0114221_109261 [Candidatus Kentron sp. FM]